MKKISLLFLISLIACSLAYANYSTGFNSSEGFTDGSTIDGIDNWTVDRYYELRGKAAGSPLTIPEGDQYFELSAYTGGHYYTQASRLLDATERVGSGYTTVAWNAGFSAWMSVSASDTMGLIYLRGDNNYGRAEAGVFGFNNGSIYYFNGAAATSGPAISTDTWYKFEVNLRAGSQGLADRWDLKVTDASANVIVDVADLYFRDSGAVTDIREISIFNNNNNSGTSPAKLSVDAITLELPISCLEVKQGLLGYSQDFNGDCYVDMDDVEELASAWLQSSEPDYQSPDLNPAIGGIGFGRQVLMDRGLQISGIISPILGGVEVGFDPYQFFDGNWTTLDYAHGHTDSRYAGPNDGVLWSRYVQADKWTLYDVEIPHVNELVSLQFKDEQDITDTSQLYGAGDWIEFVHDTYPDANILCRLNQYGSQNTFAELQNFVSHAKPDMVMFDTYPFDGTLAGGSPTSLYEHMQKYRKLGLAGHDGIGLVPIPYGIYTQAHYIAGEQEYIMSESEIRLNTFAALAFGFTYLETFVYEQASIGPPAVESVLFTGSGDSSPTAKFAEYAETNRQALNLGPDLVSLLSRSVYIVPGEHLDGGAVVDNNLPSGVAEWDSSADSFITDINATNSGTANDGYRGDAVIGYFEPLTNNDVTYFMVVNGLTDPNANAIEASQTIRIDLDFLDTGITSIQKVNRDTGVLEAVSLSPITGSQYYLEQVFEGGTGELFKINATALSIEPTYKGFVTGFERVQGFVSGESIDGFDSWTVDQYYEPRGIAAGAPLTAREGKQYFELSTYAGGHSATQANRLLDANERVGDPNGSVNNAWNASLSVWMAVSSSDALGLMYLRGDHVYGRAEAGVFGFNDGSIYYINGAIGTAGPAISTDTWYKFEVNLRAGSQGVADRWDLKVTDANANIIVDVADLYFRDSGSVTDVREINILSSYDTGTSPAKLSVDEILLLPAEKPYIASCGEAVSRGLGYIEDLNQDCTVNFLDYASFAEKWLECDDPTIPDCKLP